MKILPIKTKSKTYNIYIGNNIVPKISHILKKENINFKSKKTLKWFVSSNHYKRGFCSICGSSLFFQKRSSDDYISISTGTLNKNIPPIGHIFYKYKKSKISFSKLKKFPQSAQGYFDKYIYRIK